MLSLVPGGGVLADCAKSFVETLDFSVPADYCPPPPLKETIVAEWEAKLHGPLLNRMDPAEHAVALGEFTLLEEHAKRVESSKESAGVGLGSLPLPV